MIFWYNWINYSYTWCKRLDRATCWCFIKHELNEYSFENDYDKLLHSQTIFLSSSKELYFILYIIARTFAFKEKDMRIFLNWWENQEHVEVNKRMIKLANLKMSMNDKISSTDMLHMYCIQNQQSHAYSDCKFAGQILKTSNLLCKASCATSNWYFRFLCFIISYKLWCTCWDVVVQKRHIKNFHWHAYDITSGIELLLQRSNQHSFERQHQNTISFSKRFTAKKKCCSMNW